MPVAVPFSLFTVSVDVYIHSHTYPFSCIASYASKSYPVSLGYVFATSFVSASVGMTPERLVEFATLSCIQSIIPGPNVMATTVSL